MRGIKIVEGRYKKTRGSGGDEIKREEKEQVSPHTKDNCKKVSVKNGGREEIRTKEQRSIPVVSEVPVLF